MKEKMEEKMKEKKKHRFGVIAGKFRLLHKAHKEFMIHAMTEEIEELHIIICDNANYDRYSTIEELKQAISEILREYERPYYFHIYTEGGDTTEEVSSEEWDEAVIKFVASTKGGRVDKEEIVIYNSKEAYANVLIANKYLEITQKVSISATELEKNPYKDEHYLNIAPEFARYMNKKYAISGIESSGKTQMCIRLENMFDTKFSEEAGRYYSEKYLGGSKYFSGLYEPKDFPLIAMKQIIQDKDVNLESKRMVFLDSDPVVTLRFLYYYRECYKKADVWTDRREVEFKAAELLLESIIKTYKVDKVFLLEPATFVSDGTRDELTEDERLVQFKVLKGLYEKYNIAYELIKFDGDYTKRLHEVAKIIQKDLNIVE